MNQRLGRGINALIPQNPEQSLSDMGLSTLPIEAIRLNRRQPRKNFDKEKLNELAQSIQENGIIQPLIVSKTQSSDYELIAGERRLQAAKLAGLEKVPVVIRSVSDKELLQLAIVENVQREDLNPIEEAMAYQALAEDFQLTHSEIATVVSKNRSTITNSIRLLKLQPEILELIHDAAISAGHARAILSVKDEHQLAFANHIHKYRLNVRQAEDKARSFNPDAPKNKAASTPLIKSMQKDISRIIGLGVKIKGHIHKGSINIMYNSQEELMELKKLLNKLREEQ